MQTRAVHGAETRARESAAAATVAADLSTRRSCCACAFPRRPGTPRRRLFFTLVFAALAVAGLGAASLAEAALINDPPRPAQPTAFPARDFVSGDGYLNDHFYRVEVEHPASLGGGVVVLQRRISPTGGLLEVNHPGGACWAVAAPDIQAGDIVRVVDEGTSEVDQTTVAGVTAKRPVQTAPGTVEIHGTATAADGSPLPLDQLEQRLVAGGEQFAKSRRRDLRASAAPGEDGRLAYDAAGSTSWTATYTDLTAADVELALRRRVDGQLARTRSRRRHRGRDLRGGRGGHRRPAGPVHGSPGSSAAAGQ